MGQLSSVTASSRIVCSMCSRRRCGGVYVLGHNAEVLALPPLVACFSPLGVFDRIPTSNMARTFSKVAKVAGLYLNTS